MSAPLILDADAVSAACGPADAVAAVTAALAGGLDPAADPPRHAVPLAAGQFLLMPSEASAAYAGIKVATVAPGNPGRGLPRVQASYLLFDAATLALVAVLDGTALTTLRTPAVSVAAVLPRLRAMPEPLRVAVFGAGPQAHGHVATLASVAALASVTHLVRTTGGVRIGSPQADDALRAADVVVCATSARTPLFDAGVIRDAAVVIAVGSHEPDAREVPAALCARATVVVEDVGTALREAGDVCLAIAEGALHRDDLVAMRDVVTGAVRPGPAAAGQVPGPAADVQAPRPAAAGQAPGLAAAGQAPGLDRPLLFKSVGMAWQDLVIAEAVMRGWRRALR